jgi:ArsR family transcriptional regulator, arsenate/arsenite/antimonite-responsive transcriptional repressor / arsenate reductase (thioredoxin)
MTTINTQVREKHTCPTFPGDSEYIDWSIPDPATVEGSVEKRYQAFERTAQQLMSRIRVLFSLIEHEKVAHV